LLLVHSITSYYLNLIVISLIPLLNTRKTAFRHFCFLFKLENLLQDKKFLSNLLMSREKNASCITLILPSSTQFILNFEFQIQYPKLPPLFHSLSHYSSHILCIAHTLHLFLFLFILSPSSTSHHKLHRPQLPNVNKKQPLLYYYISCLN
jgi:hypothetical protein